MNSAIKNIQSLGFQWKTSNPFIFCVHHLDKFPKGNDNLGPDKSLDGRNLGQDFTIKDGFRMYHGEMIPGFPEHPHRGFETVTIVLQGTVDHSDSMGSSGRYSDGDVQWMTAGKGMQHSEMFPLLNKKKDNPLELFQIWLNLPANKKFVEPSYKMLWQEDIPKYKIEDDQGKSIEVTLIAGKLQNIEPLSPTPDSWANDENNQVAIWLVKMEIGAVWSLPLAGEFVDRTVYFYRGSILKVAGQEIESGQAVDLHADMNVVLENGDEDGYCLLLQGKPINEPVVQHGPFVMNTQLEIQQAFNDYKLTRFGGWSWSRSDNVHPRNKGRFAKHTDGREENRGI